MNSKSRGFFVHHPVGGVKKAEPTKQAQKAEPDEIQGQHVTWEVGQFKLIRDVRRDGTVRFWITLGDTRSALRFVYAEDATRVFEQLTRSSVVVVETFRTDKRYRKNAA